MYTGPVKHITDHRGNHLNFSEGWDFQDEELQSTNRRTEGGFTFLGILETEDILKLDEEALRQHFAESQDLSRPKIDVGEVHEAYTRPSF